MLIERGVYVGVSEKMERVTVAEAAARLGVKEQAIRKRIQRGTLAHDQDYDGRAYVYLGQEAEDCGRRRPAARTPLLGRLGTLWVKRNE